MMLSVRSVDSKMETKNPDYIVYKRDQVARQFSYELARFITDNPECVVLETEDDGIKTTLYEIHVYTPKQLTRLMQDAQQHFMLGLPMIL